MSEIYRDINCLNKDNSSTYFNSHHTVMIYFTTCKTKEWCTIIIWKRNKISSSTDSDSYFQPVKKSALFLLFFKRSFVFIHLGVSQISFLFGRVPGLTVGDKQPSGKHVNPSKTTICCRLGTQHVTLKAVTKAIASLGVPRANFSLLLE